MPTEWDTYSSALELRAIADDLGVAVVPFTKGGRSTQYFGLLWQAGHDHTFVCYPAMELDFTSMHEALGFLRAIKFIRDGKIKVKRPRKTKSKSDDGPSVPLRDMRERARELIKDNKKSLEYRRGVGEILAAMHDRDDTFGLEQATMATLKGIGFSRDVYQEE
jgi:hypothetical protein